ncbi:homoserine dehydrogenase [Alkalilimnicola sp. S0819]|uniref:homoserine dehydrogenase n=1 Tax=Alkalilimnicola sp. S0819 TaxID=2613922 RepID=UPI00126219CA|nr:homoserine dehydrogenase [Alkalilimnicola sp. S0819]KAB7622656.1 homoserine dehydrogenase [Alkalilimnicola sp. S0819]MPQ17427.1 homoserine dehydrogenase [Alkalilimnicola sp. S0819]
MSSVKVGLLGLGTVGSGTVNLLSRNKDEISRRAGREIQIVHAAARNLDRPRPCPTEGIELTDDPFAVVDNPDVEIVVELIGGTEPARELVLRAIDQGKQVVTANKALIAKHGNEIFEHARAHNVTVAFEAAVAGGIPIIKAIREGLTGNRIEWLAGIINGTANFILSEMFYEGRDFADVLAEAQRLGYAEADPTFDIEGVDAAHKLTILASIAFGIPLQFDKVHVEGISQITGEDVAYAQELGYRIKHLGIAHQYEDGVSLRVHPTLVPARQLLANVDGVMNAVMVNGDAVGPTLYYGSGAGSEPTASSVVADLVDVVREFNLPPENRVPFLAFQAHALSDAPVLPMARVHTAYYLRLSAQDEPGVLGHVTRILGEHGISIEAILQKQPAPGAEDVPVILLTHPVTEGQMNDATAQIEALDSINGELTRIRVEQLA